MYSRQNQSKRKVPLRDAGCTLRRLSLQGSMTVEACLVLPIFLFFMADILSVFDMMRMQSNMMAAVHETGTRLLEDAYLLQQKENLDLLGSGSVEENGNGKSTEGGTIAEGAGSVLSLLFSETRVRAEISSAVKSNYCVDGKDTISLIRSDLLTDGETVDIVADCRLKPVFPFPGKGIPLRTRFCGHAFTGYVPHGTGDEEEQKTEDILVYVTDYGSVFHRDRNCPYLNPSIESVPVSALRYMRSADGSKYYPCELCHPSAFGTVLISDYGSRYHCDRNCPGIRRGIRTIPLTEAQKQYPPCSKCGGE